MPQDAYLLYSITAQGAADHLLSPTGNVPQHAAFPEQSHKKIITKGHGMLHYFVLAKSI